MSTVAQLIDKTVRQHLEMGGPHQLNRLQSSINTSVEELVLDWAPEANIAPGIHIEIDSEVLLVVDVSGQTLGVLRAQQGSTAASHTAAALIRVKPRFFRTQVLTELQDEIRSWPRSLYAVASANVSWSAGAYDVDLGITAGADIIRLLRAELVDTTGAEPYGDITSSVALFPAATASFTSGWRLHSLVGRNGTVRVTYAKSFVTATLDESTDLQTTVGLSVGMEDIARFGVAGRLLLGQEGERARLDTQGTNRRAEEVPPEHHLRTAKGLTEMRDKRIGEEQDRLLNQWGV